MYGDSEISKSLSCSCGVINKIGINTDYDLNHISLDVTCRSCGKEVQIELGTLPNKSNPPAQVNKVDKTPAEPAMDMFDALPGVTGYYSGDEKENTKQEEKENTKQEETEPVSSPPDPLADMMGAAAMPIGIPGVEQDSNQDSDKVLEPVETAEGQTDEDRFNRKKDSRDIDEIIDEEDATPDEKEEEELSDQEKEAFSDLFGKL